MDKIKIAAYTVTGEWHYKDTPKSHRIYSSWWYLHGNLESEVGYDKGVILEGPGISKTFIDKDINEEYTRWYLPDGIYEVEVLGINKPCIGYFWTSMEEFSNIEGEVPHMYGLVLYKDDPENKYAYKMYACKSHIL